MLAITHREKGNAAKEIIMLKKTYIKIALVTTLITGTCTAQAACESVWVDHDYNASTPAIRKQVCDSTTDIPAIDTSSCVAPATMVQNDLIQIRPCPYNHLMESIQAPF